MIGKSVKDELKTKLMAKVFLEKPINFEELFSEAASSK